MTSCTWCVRRLLTFWIVASFGCSLRVINTTLYGTSQQQIWSFHGKVVGTEVNTGGNWVHDHVLRTGAKSQHKDTWQMIWEWDRFQIFGSNGEKSEFHELEIWTRIRCGESIIFFGSGSCVFAFDAKFKIRKLWFCLWFVVGVELVPFQ